jgi:hypothetical protein
MHCILSLAIFVATTFCPGISLYVGLTLLAYTVHYLALFVLLALSMFPSDHVG